MIKAYSEALIKPQREAQIKLIKADSEAMIK